MFLRLTTVLLLNLITTMNMETQYLIQFPISTKLEKVRNLVESSQCPTVLLKADTRADVNLMNAKTFDSIFDRKELEFTSFRLDA